MECEIPGCECEARLLSLELNGQTVFYRLCEHHIDEFLDLQDSARVTSPEENHQHVYLRWLRETRSVAATPVAAPPRPAAPVAPPRPVVKPREHAPHRRAA